MNTNISIPENRLAAFCKANGITRFALFGSVLRDDFGPDSDVDVLVEFEPERIPGLLGVAAMEIALSDLFGGRKVDLRTPEDLSRYFSPGSVGRGRGSIWRGMMRFVYAI